MNTYEEDERQNLLPTTNQVSSNAQKRDWKYFAIWLWRFIIFAITGSSSIKVTRYLLNLIHYTSKVKIQVYMRPVRLIVHSN